jgi:hypothetical protein
MNSRTTKRTMDVCKYCGKPMGWPGPVGVVYGDRTAAHHACDERAEEAYQAARQKERELALRHPPWPHDQDAKTVERVGLLLEAEAMLSFSSSCAR